MAVWAITTSSSTSTSTATIMMPKRVLSLLRNRLVEKYLTMTIRRKKREATSYWH